MNTKAIKKHLKTSTLIAITLVLSGCGMNGRNYDAADYAEVAPGIYAFDEFQENPVPLKIGDVDWLLDNYKIPENIPLTEEQVKADNHTAVRLGIEEMLDTPSFLRPAVTYSTVYYHAGKVLMPRMIKHDHTVINNIPVVWGQGAGDNSRPTQTGAIYDKIDLKLESIEPIQDQGETYVKYTYTIRATRPVYTHQTTNTLKHDEHLYMRFSIAPDNKDRTKIAGFDMTFKNTITKAGEKPSIDPEQDSFSWNVPN